MPNLVDVAVGTSGVDVYNGSGGSVNVVVDLDGELVAPLS